MIGKEGLLAVRLTALDITIFVTLFDCVHVVPGESEWCGVGSDFDLS